MGSRPETIADLLEDIGSQFILFASGISTKRLPQLYNAQRMYNNIPTQLIEATPSEVDIEMLRKLGNTDDTETIIERGIFNYLRSCGYSMVDPEKQFQVDIAYETWRINELFQDGNNPAAMNRLYRLGKFDEYYQTMVYPFFQGFEMSFPQACKKEGRFLLPVDVYRGMLNSAIKDVGEQSNILAIANFNEDQTIRNFIKEKIDETRFLIENYFSSEILIKFE